MARGEKGFDTTTLKKLEGILPLLQSVEEKKTKPVPTHRDNVKKAYYHALRNLQFYTSKLNHDLECNRGLEEVIYWHKVGGWSTSPERNGIPGEPAGAVVLLVKINRLTLDLAEKLGLPIKEANRALLNYKETKRARK